MFFFSGWCRKPRLSWGFPFFPVVTWWNPVKRFPDDELQPPVRDVGDLSTWLEKCRWPWPLLPPLSNHHRAQHNSTLLYISDWFHTETTMPCAIQYLSWTNRPLVVLFSSISWSLALSARLHLEAQSLYCPVLLSCIETFYSNSELRVYPALHYRVYLRWLSISASYCSY